LPALFVIHNNTIRSKQVFTHHNIIVEIQTNTYIIFHNTDYRGTIIKRFFAYAVVGKPTDVRYVAADTYKIIIIIIINSK